MEMRNLAKEAVLIEENATFREALSLMMHRDTNSLFVVNTDGVLIGEVNVSDLLDAIVPMDVAGDTIESQLGSEDAFGNAVLSASDLPVSAFLNPEIHPVRADDSLIAIAGVAIAHQTAHLPIVDHDDRPVGVISRRALKHILASFLDIQKTLD
ncbi:MAG TPA: CBS domain-containing protein [Candidatus Paceibacterota bacterium]|nr:CBS domain-containing protein [Candidatus Paceibacterota bacterium]